jgi:hypothetical protein
MILDWPSHWNVCNVQVCLVVQPLVLTAIVLLPTFYDINDSSKMIADWAPHSSLSVCSRTMVPPCARSSCSAAADRAVTSAAASSN